MCGDNTIEKLFNFFYNRDKQLTKNEIKEIVKRVKDEFCSKCCNKEYIEHCRSSFKKIFIFIKDCNIKEFYGFLKSRESRLIAYLDMPLVDKISFELLYSILSKK